MNVSVINQQKVISIDEELVQKQVLEVLVTEKISADEVAVYFVDTETISKLHLQFFNDASPTDCISLSYDPPKKAKDSYCFLGEVFICTEIAISYAKNIGAAPQEEVALYLIHGLLHLVGYDDMKPEDEVLMRAKEKEHLSHFRQLNLLPSSTNSTPLEA